MADPIGASFAPTFENADLAARGGVAGSFPQGAIQILNYRLPTVGGAAGVPGSISPLLGDTRRGGFGSAVLQSVLHTILGPDAGGLLGGSDDTFAAGLRRERQLNPGADTFAPSPATPPYTLPTPTAPRADASPFPDQPAPPTPPRPGDGTTVHIGGDQNLGTAGGPNFTNTPSPYSGHDERAARFRNEY